MCTKGLNRRLEKRSYLKILEKQILFLVSEPHGIDLLTKLNLFIRYLSIITRTQENNETTSLQNNVVFLKARYKI